MVLNTNQPFLLVQKKSKKQIVLSKLEGKTGCELDLLGQCHLHKLRECVPHGEPGGFFWNNCDYMQT